jgi:hypothetical protein
MAQLNLNLTPEFKKDLEKYMKHKSLRTKSDAIRMALREVVALLTSTKKTDYSAWLGAGLKAQTRNELQFKSEDDLWRD